MITQRVKRSSDQHYNKATLILNQITPNIFAPYAQEQKHKPAKPHPRPKGKENKRGKRSIKKEEFPEFAIKFRNQTFQSKQATDSQCSNNIPQSLQESFGKNQMQNKAAPSKKVKGKQQKRSYVENKKYEGQYGQALDKIFKSLDVFNRGRISQTNINKWIPESALYFLGSIFQKIRQQRLNLNLMEFMLLCKPLLFESGEDDVKWFIEQVNGKQLTLNISINSSSEEKESSPVQMRMNYRGEKQTNKQEPASTQRQENIFNDDVFNKMRCKQAELNMRLNSIKNKHNSRNTPKNQSAQFSFFNSIKNQPKQQPKLQSNSKKANDYFDKIILKNDEPVPSFTYKLPKQYGQKQRPLSINEREPRTRRTPQKTEDRFQYEESIPNPRTSRIVRQSIPKGVLSSSSSKRQRQSSQEPDRIDKLSSRLQEYIQFNRQKIEQNKKFLRQNSLPRQ